MSKYKGKRTRTTLRMPDTLKIRIDAWAKSRNLYLNDWIVGCLENEASKIQEKDNEHQGQG